MPKWNFLWLTDVHYEGAEDNYLDVAKELGSHESEYREKVFPNIYSILKKKSFGVPLSFIGVGGDITTRCADGGFSKFSEFLVPKLKSLVDTPESICVVPGNHDVPWELNPKDKDYFDLKFAPFSRAIQKDSLTTCLMPHGSIESPVFRSIGSGPIFRDPDKKILVVAINSAIRCGELISALYGKLQGAVPSGAIDPNSHGISSEFDAFRGDLIRDVSHVTQTQIEVLEALLDEEKRNTENWDDYLRVAIVHHHLAPYPGQQLEHRGYELMVDSSRVLDLLGKFDFHIALTGHRHEGYQFKYSLRGEKQLFVVGGTTVGGFPVGGKRGFRFITVEADRYQRKLTIKDIEHGFALQDTAIAIRDAVPKVLVISKTTDEILASDIDSRGYSCSEVVASTRITADGDAIREIEYHKFAIEEDEKVIGLKEMMLPTLSGYPQKIRVGPLSEDTKHRVAIESQPSEEWRDVPLRISFDPRLMSGDFASFQYEWVAVNAFAQDQNQFRRKYPSATKLQNIEFAYFSPVDPSRRLTLIVQFPRGFKVRPWLNVTVVGPDSDMRCWEPDEIATRGLIDQGALRYFSVFNAAVLQVKAPSTKLSYRIQWQLPNGTELEGRTQAQSILKSFDPTADFVPVLAKILDISRTDLLVDQSHSGTGGNWDGELDASLMIFDLHSARQKLSMVGAIRSSGSGERPVALRKDVEPFYYGEGVSGRAFKTNVIRLWDAEEAAKPSERLEPDFYIRRENTPEHKGLISFPLHLAVSDEVFHREKFNSYRSREPYGVLSIGTDQTEWPIEVLKDPKRNSALQIFQHTINKMIGGKIAESRTKSENRQRN